MKHPKIWCDITCFYCGHVASQSGYYSPERIKLLKQEAKQWSTDHGGNPVCPYCNLGTGGDDE